MSFKDMAAKILGESVEKKDFKEIVEEVVINEELDVKIEVPTERVVTEKSELNFVGSFNYVPDPIEYNEGSIYKNINEGVAYIRKGLLWEELVRDGKPGRDAARVGGSGVGVAEVKSITGMLGIFDSKAELDKVPTSNLKIGTIATLPSGPVTWRGAGAGGWKSIKAKRSVIAPYNQSFTYNTVDDAFGFTERFKAPVNAVGFDVAWYSCAASGTLVKSTWGRVGNLTGSYQQQSPAQLKISGVNISNATIPAGSLTLPASALISDFVGLTILAGDVIEIRSNTSGAGRGYNASVRGYDSYAYGGADLYSSEVSAAVGGTGDCITGNPSVNCAVGNVTIGVCMIRWYSQSGVLSVLECGDSITKGEAGFSGQAGAGNIAPLHLAASIDKSISPIVFGQGGNNSGKFNVSAISLIPVFKPSIVIIPVWSPNDGVINIDGSINNALHVCSVAIENGAVPYLKTPNPWSYTGSNLTLWQAGVARVRAICASNPAIGMIDIAAALEDPANPGAMKPAYFGTAVDGQRLHPNPAGKWAEAQAYAAALSGLV